MLRRHVPKAKIGKQFKSNFIWTLFGNAFFGMSQWLIISLMTKLGNVEMVGEYTLALGITAPLFLLLNFNLRSMQATDQTNKFDFAYYFSFRNITSLIALLITIVAMFLMNNPTSTSLVIILVAVVKVIESQSDIVFGYFQKNEYLKIISISKILKGIFNILIITIALLITKSLIIALIGLLIVNLVLLFVFDMKKLYENKVRRIKTKDLLSAIKDKKNARAILLLGIPLGIASFLDSLTINSQRYIVESSLSIKELGYYSSIIFIMMSGQVIIGALAHAALPRLAKDFIEDINSFVKTVKTLVLVGIFIGTVLIVLSSLFGDIILSILYTKEFVRYSDLFFIIMIVASIWYLTGFLNTALLATRRFNAQLYVYLLSFTVTLICTLIFTNDQGLVGAAYGLLAGMIVRLLVVSFVLLNIIISKKNNIPKS
ncbi:MAG: lipopolysaccharide biosynthesis protein [Bacillus sp. (in: firmicutes)]